MGYEFFVIGSMIEYLGFFFFMFTLFRFKFRKWIGHLIIVSFLMSQVSYFTRLNPNIGDLSSFIQFALLIIVLWVLFRVPLFYSIVMNGAAFVCGFALQGIVIIILSINGITVQDMQADGPMGTFVQVVDSIIIFMLSRVIFLKNWGFDYVPTSHRAKVKITGLNAVLLCVIIFSASVACLIAYLLRYEYASYILYVSCVFIFTLPLFLYYSYRKDEEDAS